MLTNTRGFWTLLKRETLRFLSLPNQTMVPAIISAVLYIFVFGKFLGPRVRPIDGFSYIVFIFPGILMMGVVTSTFQNASTSLFISRWERFIDDLLVSPISYIEMVFAYVLASMIRGVINGLVVLPIGLLLLPTPLEHPFLLVFALVSASLVFSAFGLIVGLWAERWDNIAVYLNYVIMPLTFLGGVFYSTKMLPDGFRWINEINPIFYMVSAVRFSFLGHADASYTVSMIVITGLAVIFCAWVFLLFQRGYKLRS